MKSKADLGELVALMFDRMPEEFPGMEIQDAMLLVELHDPEDPEATLVAIECTSDRITIRSGILDFGQKSLWARENDELD